MGQICGQVRSLARGRPSPAAARRTRHLVGGIRVDPRLHRAGDVRHAGPAGGPHDAAVDRHQYAGH